METVVSMVVASLAMATSLLALVVVAQPAAHGRLMLLRRMTDAWGIGSGGPQDRSTPYPPTRIATAAGAEMVGPYALGHVMHRGVGREVAQAIDTRCGTALAYKHAVHHSMKEACTDSRLAREGAVLREVRHPHVVALHAAGRHHGVPYVATRLLEGGTLADRLAEAPHGLAPQEVARIVGHVAAGLEATHRTGWVHRDVKAPNVLYDPRTDRWVLGDFGIAQPIAEPEFDRLTEQGKCIGTVTHMAPELVAAGNVRGDGAATPASDVYALTILTFQLLTGRLPLNPLADHASIACHQLYGEMPTLAASHPQLSGLDEVLAHGWEKDRGRRYPTPTAFAAALDSALDGTVSADQMKATALVEPTTSTGADSTTTLTGAGAGADAGGDAGAGGPTRCMGPTPTLARTSAQTSARTTSRTSGRTSSGTPRPQPPRWAMTPPPPAPDRSAGRPAQLRRWFEEALAGAVVARDLTP